MDYVSKTGKQFTIGTVGKEFIAELVNMRMEYIKADFGISSGDECEEIRSKLPAYFEKHLENDLFAYTAMENGKMAATVFLAVDERPASPSYMTGKKGTLLNVLTLEDYRHHGLAKQLVQMAINDGRNLGLSHIELSATSDGYGLYKLLGFEDSKSHYTEMIYHY